MIWLLDTNVVSEMRKVSAGRADPGVAAWARSRPAGMDWISAITLFELELAIARVERRDAEAGRRLRDWMETAVLVEYADRTAPVDSAIAQRAARLHVPDPRPERDALIAAAALVHRLTVVTRNVRDFEPMGVPVVNPWKGSARAGE